MKNVFLIIVTLLSLCYFPNEVQAKINYAIKTEYDTTITGFSEEEIGYKVPDITLCHILNYPTPTAKLSDFVGKWVLIDFWNIFCGPCLAAMNKIEDLQKQFEGRLQVLTVTFQDQEMIKNFLIRRKKATNLDMHLPIICSDTVLRQLFKHATEPHYVWIDPSGRVSQITGYQDVTADNIERLLNHENLSLKVKTDEEVPYDISQPLFVNGNGGEGKELLYHSALSKLIKWIPSMVSINCNEKMGYSVKMTNMELKALYQRAYDNGQDDSLGRYGVPSNRTFLEVKDSSKYYGILNGTPNYENWYCYELITHKTTLPELRRMMQADLQRYFGLRARIEKRKMLCLVISSADTTLFQSAGGARKLSISRYFVELKNAPLKPLIVQLIYDYLHTSPYPIVNEIGYTGNVDLKLEADITDVQSLANAFQKYKIDIRLKEREVEVLVISE